MESSDNFQNYHWNECNISAWIKEKTEEELKKRKYEIISTDFYVKLCSRMNKLGLVYSISIDATKNEETSVLENFNSTSSENEGLKKFPWFVDFFKELEAQAIIKFSKNVLDLGKKNERSFAGIQNIEANEVKTGNFKYISLINCSFDEFFEFLTNQSYVVNWAHCVTFDDQGYTSEQFTLKNITKVENGLELKFKLNTWENFTNVTIKFQNIRENTKLDIFQKNVPFKDLDLMKVIWKNGIISAICMNFGFVERSFMDE